jgi:hypothetical protein
VLSPKKQSVLDQTKAMLSPLKTNGANSQIKRLKTFSKPVNLCNLLKETCRKPTPLLTMMIKAPNKVKIINKN